MTVMLEPFLSSTGSGTGNENPHALSEGLALLLDAMSRHSVKRISGKIWTPDRFSFVRKMLSLSRNSKSESVVALTTRLHGARC